MFIEDSHESLCSVYQGQKARGSDFADVAVFAFYPNKQMTSSRGGMAVIDDDRIAALCDSMRNQGWGEVGCDRRVRGWATTATWTRCLRCWAWSR